MTKKLAHINTADTKLKKAFTLAELVLAMFISSLIVLSLAESFRNALTILEKIQTQQQTSHHIRNISELIRNELAGTYFPVLDQKNAPVFTLNSTDNDSAMEFYTLTPAYSVHPSQSKISRLRYRFAFDPNTGQSSLKRYQQYFAAGKPISNELCDEILNTTFQLSLSCKIKNENDQWRQNFQSFTKLPQAVKIQLSIKDNNDNNHSAETIFYIPCNQQVNNDPNTE